MNEAHQPRVEIIVPNYNGHEYLAACLTSILQQNYANYLVTVVDNASTDRSVELIIRDFPDVRVMEMSHNTGFAGGCNEGLKQALKGDADYFVLVNTDTQADANWLAELVIAAESDPGIGICQSMIRLAKMPNRINSAGNESHFLAFGYCGHYLEEDQGQFPTVMDVPFASGTAMLIRRQTIEKIGMMDEDLFMYQEDLDLSWRARLAGWRVVLASRSLIYHDYVFGRNKTKFYFLERNRLIVSLKNYSGRSILILTPAFLGAEIAMLCYSLKGGWFRQKLQGYLFLLRTAGRISRKRSQVQQLRYVDDAVLVTYWNDRMDFPDMQKSALTTAANVTSKIYWKYARKLI